MAMEGQIEAWSPVIEAAIEYHGVFQVPDGLPENVLLFTQLIRDADKLDNFRSRTPVHAGRDGSECSQESLSDYAFIKKSPSSTPSGKPGRICGSLMWLIFLTSIFLLPLSGSVKAAIWENPPTVCSIDPEDKTLAEDFWPYKAISRKTVDCQKTFPARP